MGEGELSPSPTLMKKMTYTLRYNPNHKNPHSSTWIVMCGDMTEEVRHESHAHEIGQAMIAKEKQRKKDD